MAFSRDGLSRASVGRGDLERLPDKCGVYIMRDKSSRALYIGKASSLRNRVRSYFASSRDQTSLTEKMLGHVESVEYIVTGNEKEAFLLEDTLIKENRPRYNIRLRDDKTYVSVRIDTEEEWPRAVVLRRRGRDQARYFGPYSSARLVRETLDFLQKVFPIRSCNDAFFRSRTRPCILHEIGRCVAPCVLPVPREEYMELVHATILFLRGRYREIVKVLEKQMRHHAETLEFEKAGRVRDCIGAVKNTMESQKVIFSEGLDADVLAFREKGAMSIVGALFYRNGVLVEQGCFTLSGVTPSAGAAVAQFAMQFYGSRHEVPTSVLFSHEPEDAEFLKAWLCELAGRSVRLETPARGRKRQIVKLALENAGQFLEQRLQGKREIEKTLERMAVELRLPQPPEIIDAVDISNIHGAQAVGAMVRFVDGQPEKAGYRLFRIRDVEGIDDVAMVGEVVKRRFRRLLEEERRLPDLLLIDGGKGHLNVAAHALAELPVGEGTSVVAIAKGRRVETQRLSKSSRRAGDHIFLVKRKNPVSLERSSPVLYLLQRVRDEAHRFVITSHRRWRQKEAFRSILDDLPGIGPKRRRALLRYFGSLEGLRSATAEEIVRVPGIHKQLAGRIHSFLRLGCLGESGRRR